MLNNIVILAQTAPPANAQQGGGAGSGLIGMLPIFVIFGVMIFMMFRSQKKQANKRKEMLNAIKSGDDVVTNGGIKGTIVKVKDDGFILKIAENVQIEVVKAAVSNIIGKEDDEYRKGK